jgi:hypothetical protein
MSFPGQFCLFAVSLVSNFDGRRQMIERIPRLATNSSFYLLPALAICVLLVSLSGPAAAQRPNYGRTYTKSQVEKLIKDVEQSGKDFRRDFDRWLDHSSLDGQQREDRYNKQVKSLTSALSTLRSNFNRNSDWWLSRNDMQRVLNEARPVNSIMRNPEVRGSLDRQWGQMRRNLDRLAEAFNLPGVGSSFSGNQRPFPSEGGVVPNWAIGTFRGMTNNGETELTIAANGAATARSLVTNATYPGRYANEVLYFDWGAFNLARESGGISLVEIGNELNRTLYRSVSNYGGNGPTYPQPRHNNNIIPSWAVGTFRGMTNNGESELIITVDGVATVGALNSNVVYHGNYANNVLTFDWGSFNLVREDQGFSTVEISNQQNRTSYVRVQ